MDRLTMDEIEKLRDSKYPWAQLGKLIHGLPSNSDAPDEAIRYLCDLALQSLSQEAVRDEALEPLTDDERNDAIEDFRKAVTYFRLTGKIPQGYSQATFIERVGDFALRYLRAALKREPNAAGDGLTKLAALPQEMQTLAESLAGPAPAAPVAEILDDWRIVAEFFQSRNWPDTKLGDAASRLQSRLPALLAKLGQGWVPVGKRDTPLWPSCPKFIECTRADGQVFRLNIPSLPTQARNLR